MMYKSIEYSSYINSYVLTIHSLQYMMVIIDCMIDRQVLHSSSVCNFFLKLSSFFWFLTLSPERCKSCSGVSSSVVRENSSGLCRPEIIEVALS